jgi:phosphopantothenoylcysteine synthetase/decarboxylase
MVQAAVSAAKSTRRPFGADDDQNDDDDDDDDDNKEPQTLKKAGSSRSGVCLLWAVLLRL